MPNHTQQLSSIDAPTTEVLELSRSSLADVRFPDVDSDTLDVAAKEVAEKAAEVERLRASLGEAEDALHAAQSQLREKAQLAHSYAKVYATNNEALSASLESISFESEKPRTAKKTRARKTKPKTPQLLLDNDGERADKADTSADLARAAG